jgi:hypothetical protein
MKVPTSGTSVFSPLAVNNSTGTVNTTGFPIDMQLKLYRDGSVNLGLSSRLRGISNTTLNTNTTSAEVGSGLNTNYDNTGFTTGSSWSGASMIYENFRRAPSFFDEVCYTGTGSDQNISHNLAVQPNLLIIKRRTGGTSDWNVAYQIPSFGNDNLCLNLTVAAGASQTVNNGYGACTSSSVFGVIGATTSNAVNASGSTYVAYLFATCAGVSKVGGYTGNGSSQTINCGFTGGARFVLIKKSSGTGDWMVSDSARGIVSGNDPYLELNNTNAEVTGEDWLDTDSTGFVVNEVSGSNANTSGASYIFLAIA